jgi:hypothetical protein
MHWCSSFDENFTFVKEEEKMNAEKYNMSLYVLSHSQSIQNEESFNLTNRIVLETPKDS